MPAPIIGITAGQTKSTDQTPQLSLSEKYIQAVWQAGGAPVVLPAILVEGDLAVVLDRLDGLLLTGGGDIDPAIFGGQPHPIIYGIDHERDLFEIELVRLAARSGKPFLGICRGIQVINVALGGSLYTDIAAQMPNAERHDFYPNFPRDKIAHPIRIEKGSLLQRMTHTDELGVNSLHHQGLERIAPALHPTAHAPDGLVEAVELREHPFGLGVQWHPEWLTESEGSRALFRGLVQAAEHKQ